MSTATGKPGRPSKAEPFRGFVNGLLTARPDAKSLEIVEQAKAQGYEGKKSALYRLVAEVRLAYPRPPKPVVEKTKPVRPRPLAEYVGTLGRAFRRYVDGLPSPRDARLKVECLLAGALGYLGDVSLDVVAGGAGGVLLRRYIDERLAEGRSHSTMKVRLRPVRRALELALRRGELTALPIPWPILSSGAAAAAKRYGICLTREAREAIAAKYRGRTRPVCLEVTDEAMAVVLPPGAVGLMTVLGWVLLYAARRCTAPTLGMHEDNIDLLLRWFGDRPLDDFRGGRGYKLLWRYVEAEGPDGRGVKYTTISKRLMTLRMALTEAVKREEIDALPPFPELPADSEPRERYATYGEYQALRGDLLPERRIWPDLAVWTAQHPKDLRLMTWADVNLGGGAGAPPVGSQPAFWLRRNTKNRVRPLWLEMPEELREHLTAEWRRRGTPSPTEKIINFWASDLTATKMLRQASLRVGIAPITSMDLRRTCATWWIDKGGDKDALRVWMGHAQNSQMVDRHYAKVTPNKLHGGVAALNRAAAAPTDRSSEGAPLASSAEGRAA